MAVLRYERRLSAVSYQLSVVSKSMESWRSLNAES
jgi:hypothetical protein